MSGACILVIGHVDHGKTSLLRALTGIETDRLPEEKQRGLSIVTGFAHHTYSGGTVDFIDAPGHSDFIPAMVAGASGARACLIVVSMVDGVCAQTLEHVTIAALLGITQAVIAVTKADLVPAGEQDAQMQQIRHDLAQSVFGQAAMVACSAKSAGGVANLHSAIEKLATAQTGRALPLASMLPIDRVFTLPGRGTIVTGTLLGQAMSVNDALVLHPGGGAVTLRSLQTRDVSCDTVAQGARMAASLRGVGADAVVRGMVLCAGDAIAPALSMDVKLTVLAQAHHPLRHMERVRLLIGTVNTIATVRLFGGGRVAQGKAGYAQLRFDQPVVSFAGQAGVIRRLSPVETLGSVVVLDPQATPTGGGDKTRLATLHAVTLGDPTGVFAALRAGGGGVVHQLHLSRLLRVAPADLDARLNHQAVEIVENMITASPEIESACADILARLADYHAAHPRRLMAERAIIEARGRSPVLTAFVLNHLAQGRKVTQWGDGLALATHDPITLLTEDQRARMETIAETFQRAHLAPPARNSVAKTALDADLLALLTHSGTLIGLQNVALKQSILLHTSTVCDARETLTRAFGSSHPFSTSDARIALGTSRRIIVPLLEYFDRLGITLRSGNTRQMAPNPPVSLTPPAC